LHINILKHNLEHKAQWLTLIELARGTHFDNRHKFETSSIWHHREFTESWMHSARKCQAANRD
jgi:hypothetical protein